MDSRISKGALLWAMQASSGLVLVASISLHWFAQHLVVQGGLRDYSQVASYLREPWLLTLELSFLVVVTTHVLVGLRSILIDLGPGRRLERHINLGLGLAGTVVIAYGCGLTLALIR